MVASRRLVPVLGIGRLSGRRGALRRRAGAIVNLSSGVALFGQNGAAAYCATKGAISAMSKSLAIDEAAHGVRVNCVCPSIVDTPMSRADLGLGDRGFADAAFPVQTADEVARHVLYLASPASRPINGQAVVSDFGYLARSSFPA